MLNRLRACSSVLAWMAVSACGGGDEAVNLAPLAAGSGVFFTDGNTGMADAGAGFYKLNEISGDTAQQPVNGGESSDGSTLCPALFALDARPDGMVLAVGRNTPALYEADVRATACRQLAALPEVMVALAVRADGHIFTVSATQKLHELDAQARVLFSSPMQCAANTAPCRVDGIDFGSDGTLYAIGAFGLWSRVDTASGQLSTIKTGVGFSDDFDIDTTGLVRGLEGGEYRRFDLAGNPAAHAINVFGGTAFATGVVYR